MTRPRSPAAASRWMLGALLGTIVLVVILSGIDLGRRRRARDEILAFAPAAALCFESPAGGGTWVGQVREAAGGVLPLDRLGAVRLNSVDVDDAAAPRVVTAIEALGGVRELELGSHGMSETGLTEFTRLRDVERLAPGHPAARAAPGAAGRLPAGWQKRFLPRTDRWLTRFPKLATLDLTSSDVGDRAVPALLDCRSLCEISGEYWWISDAGLMRLAGQRTLKRVSVIRGGVSRDGAWAFRFARPDIFVTGLATPPASLTRAELDEYRRERDRLRGSKRSAP